MTSASPTRMEAACSLLAEPARRVLLYELAEHRDASIEDLVTQICAWKFDGRTDVDDDTRQQIYITLVHNHLPRLADYGIVQYDLRSGDVVLADGFDDIKPLLEQFKQTEEEPELRQRPPL